MAFEPHHMLCSQIPRVVQDITGLIRSDICAQSDLLPSTYIDIAALSFILVFTVGNQR